MQRISEQQAISNTWTPSFFGYDGGGSVRALTNSAGAVTDSYEYDGFGNEISSTGSTPNSYLYRGEAYDSDLGLYYLRARWMNPLTGRFLSRDPEDGIPIDPITLHKYLYAGGDPVNGMDPTGRSATVEVALTDTWAQSRDIVAGTIMGLALRCAYNLLASETHAWTALGLAGDGDSGTVKKTGPCSVEDDDYCREQRDEDINYCAERYPATSRGRQYCIARAKQNYINCLAGKPRQPLDPMHPKWRTD